MRLVREHFNECLLAALALVFALLTIIVLAKEGWAAGDGFKFFSTTVAGIIGALLALLMKQNPPPVVVPGQTTSMTKMESTSSTPVALVPPTEIKP